MTTTAYDEIRDFAKAWEKIFKSAVCSGIIGDARHAAQGGYHIGRKYQGAFNYSVVRPQDRNGNGPDDASCGIDMSMNRADMIECTRRLKKVWANKDDPRRKYLNAFNGWDGTGDATRFDVYASASKYATIDHTWHVHLEVRRLYARAAVAFKAILSALRNESVEEYKRSVGVILEVSTRKPPAVPAWPGVTYKRDDRMRASTGVQLWQARMIARGWTTLGKADGLFGAKTEAVVRRMQELSRLPVTGKIDKATWALPWARRI